MIVRCNDCGKPWKIKDDQAKPGRKIRCKACQGTITIPEEDPSASVEPVTYEEPTDVDRNLASQVKELESALNESAKREESLKIKVADFEKILGESQKLSKEAMARQTKADETIASLKKEIKEAEDKAKAAADVERKLEKSEKKLFEAEEKAKELEKDLKESKSAAGKADDADKKVAKVEEKLAKAEEKLAKSEEKLYGAEDKLSEAQKKIKDLEKELKEAGSSTSEMEKLNKRIADLEKELEEAAAQPAAKDSGSAVQAMNEAIQSKLAAAAEEKQKQIDVRDIKIKELEKKLEDAQAAAKGELKADQEDVLSLRERMTEMESELERTHMDLVRQRTRDQRLQQWVLRLRQAKYLTEDLNRNFQPLVHQLSGLLDRVARLLTHLQEFDQVVEQTVPSESAPTGAPPRPKPLDETPFEEIRALTDDPPKDEGEEQSAVDVDKTVVVQPEEEEKDDLFAGAPTEVQDEGLPALESPEEEEESGGADPMALPQAAGDQSLLGMSPLAKKKDDPGDTPMSLPMAAGDQSLLGMSPLAKKRADSGAGAAGPDLGGLPMAAGEQSLLGMSPLAKKKDAPAEPTEIPPADHGPQEIPEPPKPPEPPKKKRGLFGRLFGKK